MAAFEPDGVYNSIPFRVLPDGMIEALISGKPVRFKNREQFVASISGGSTDTNGTHSIISHGMLDGTNKRNVNVPVSAKPLDYYSTLLEAIRTTKQNSAQLRALVYERARFNLKRDILFGNSLVDLADVVRKVKEFELAVARIEENAIDDQLASAEDEQGKLLGFADVKPKNAIQVFPPEPDPRLYAQATAIQRVNNLEQLRLSQAFVQHLRFANKIIGVGLFGMAIIGAVIITLLWPYQKSTPQFEAVNKLPKSGETAAMENISRQATIALPDGGSKVPIPVPTSFGIYALNNDSLVELKALPINIPDPRIALSAEIKAPSTALISDRRPSFILFRRDLLNNAPQKLILRVIARVARVTRIVGGKAGESDIEGVWRIRNMSRELKISPIAGQSEMIIAHLDENVSLAAGRYALVLNRTGYDFTITGAVQSPAFCLEEFETANGSVFNQCRSPQMPTGNAVR
jgi:hypothetical protein